MTPKHIAVIDVGKTNAKLALVDAASLTEVAVVTRPNAVLPGPPYRHFDVEGHWDFFLDQLAGFHSQHGVDAISITTHGGAGVLLASDGTLAAPVLDYEETGLDEVAARYNAIRPDFTETGSPRLPGGLNLGAQIYWQFSIDESLYDRTTALVTYPQYWGHRLTGVLACDVSSLGCHTDLWNPHQQKFSSLVDVLKIANKVAPARPSGDVLGPILPTVAERTGLSDATPVYCGIHDSNASLLPHVLQRRMPFSVVSTGTWVIVMSMGGEDVMLDPSRDTLINVNGLGNPVPSARFMGGREFDFFTEGASLVFEPDDLDQVAKNGPLLMPGLVTNSGPFPGQNWTWIGKEPAVGSSERSVAIGYYLAMMTAECLTMTGHKGDIVVEGPFSNYSAYCRMLSAATECAVVAAQGTTGTSSGAALLALGANVPDTDRDAGAANKEDSMLYRDYARRWRSEVRKRTKAAF